MAGKLINNQCLFIKERKKHYLNILAGGIGKDNFGL